METDKFEIRSYGWTELAVCYNPEVSPETAAKRLNRWVHKNTGLHSSLRHLGWGKGSRLLTPLQVETIIRHLGEP
jgi:hypothetical protein